MLDRRECLVDLVAVRISDLLTYWRWLIGNGQFELIRATVFGDLFLRDSVGQIYFLDTMEGTFRPFGLPGQDLHQALDNRHVRGKLLMPLFVEELREAGKLLAAEQCYSPDIPIVLGGGLDVSNYQPADIRVHVSMMGQIHRQAKNQSPGTKIRDVEIIEEAQS